MSGGPYGGYGCQMGSVNHTSFGTGRSGEPSGTCMHFRPGVVAWYGHTHIHTTVQR